MFLALGHYDKYYSKVQRARCFDVLRNWQNLSIGFLLCTTICLLLSMQFVHRVITSSVPLVSKRHELQVNHFAESISARVWSTSVDVTRSETVRRSDLKHNKARTRINSMSLLLSQTLIFCCDSDRFRVSEPSQLMAALRTRRSKKWRHACLLLRCFAVREGSNTETQILHCRDYW